MKYLILLLNVLGFWLMADAAHAEPISLAISSIASFLTSMGAIGKLVLTVALNIGLSLVEKALAKKEQPQAAGTKLEISMGDDHPMSFIIGSYATAGKRKYAGTWGDDGKTPNAYFTDVIEIGSLPNRAGERGLTSVWIDDQKVGVLWDQPHPDGRGFPVLQYRVKNKDYLWIKFLDGTQTSPDPFLMAKFGAHAERPWKPTMIGRGCQVVILTSRYNTDLFKGVPAGLFEPHPLPLYDVRKDSSVGGNGAHRWSDPSTWQPSTNPAVMVYNLARGAYYGSEWVYGGQNIGAFCLPATNWMAAANACDASVKVDDNNGEPAFRAGYDVQCDQEPLDAVSELLKGCNGRMAEVGGVFKMLVGAPGGAVYSFTDNDIIVTEEQEFQPFPSLSATYNAIEATYPEPAEKWATKDAPGRYNADLETEDGNRRLPAQIQLLAVPFANQVQRVGLAMIQDYRRFRVHQVSLPPDAYPLEPNDVVSWSSARNGYDEKKFLVVKVEPQSNFLIVVTLKEVDPADYDWHPGLQLPTAIGWIGPITPPSQPMVGWTVEPATVKDAGGIDRRPAIRISCASDLDDISGVWVQVRVKASGDVVFDSDSNPYASPYSWLISGQWTLPNVDYEARGRYLPQSNRATDWSAWLTVKTPNVLVQAGDVLDGAIIQSKIADAAVSAAKIMDEAVSNLKLANQAVSTAKIEVAAVTADVLASGAVIASKLADGAVTARALAQGAVDATALASSLKAVEVVNVLPTTGNVEGRQVFLTTDGKLYRYHNGAWTATVAAGDVNGTLNSSQIADNAITNNKLAPLAVDASKLADGSVSAAKLAQGAVDVTKFASGIKPVEIVSSLPASGNVEGRQVFLTTDGKLYRYHNGAWTAATPASDITGQMTDAQIAAVAAAKVAGTLASSQIADSAITNSKLAALAVDAAKLADNAITTTKISDNAISTSKLQANAITADKIAANSITAKQLVLTDFSNMIDNGWQSGSLDGWGTYFVQGFIFDGGNTTGAAGWRLQSNSRNQAISRDTPVSPGESYFFDAWVFQADPNHAASVYAVQRDAAGGNRTYPIIAAASAKNVWTRLQATFTLAPMTTYLQIVLVCEKPDAEAGVGPSTYWTKPVLRRAASAELIVDGAITATKIAAGSVTTAALAAGAVIADDIAANAVTAGKIAAGSVTADKIAANSITAGQIAAGAISATQIAAKAITVDKLLVANLDNQIDQGFSIGSRANWYAPHLNNYYLEVGTSPAGGTYIAQCDGRDQLMVNPTLIRVSPGESYNMSVWVYNTDPDYIAFMGMYVKDSMGASIAPTWIAVGPNSFAKNAWTLLQGNVTIPAGVYMVQPMFGVGKSAPNGKFAFWARPNMRRASGAELIVDGAITAAKVAANAITADKIAANAILAKNIVMQDWENLVPNGRWEDVTSPPTDYYTYYAEAPGGLSWITDPANAVSGKTYLRLNKPNIGASCDAVLRAFVPVVGNSVLHWSVNFKVEDGTQATPAGIFIRALWYDANQNQLAPNNQPGTGYTDLVGNSGTTPGWNNPTGKVAVPSQARFFRIQYINWVNSTARALDIGSMVIRRANAANLIVDGTITGNLIAAQAITADKMAANSVTAGTIAAGAVAAAQIAAGAITADKLAAGSVSTQSLAVGNGNNYLSNSDLAAGLTGWGPEYSNDAVSFSLGLRTDTYAPLPGAIEVRQLNGKQGIEFGVMALDAYGNRREFGVKGSGWYELSGYYFGHRCIGVQPYFAVLDVNGNVLAYPSWGIFPAYQNADPQKNLVNYSRFWGKYQMPANAAKAIVFFRMKGTVAGQGDSYLWLTRMYFGEANPNQTEPTPWSDGSVTVISGGNIVTGAVSADKIAANAVTAGKIAANAVTAGTIAAGAVTATTIAGGTITGDKLAANTIGANQIAAGAITAKSLVLTDFSNIVDNGWQGGNLDGWSIQNLQNFYLDGSNGDWAGYVVQSLARDCCWSKAVAVTTGEVYAFDVWVYNADAGTANVYVAIYTGNGVLAIGPVTSTTTKNSWVRLQGRYTVPSGYVKLAMLLQVDKTAGTGNSCYWSKPVMRRATSGELIVDGAITGNKIAANAITAGQIATGAITTDKLILGGVTYDKIAPGACTDTGIGRVAGVQNVSSNGNPFNLVSCGVTVAGDGRVVVDCMAIAQINKSGGAQNSQAVGLNIFRNGLLIFQQVYYLPVVRTVVSGGGNGTTSSETYTAGCVGISGFYDAPGAGWQVYTMQINNPGNTVGWAESNIAASSYKR